MQIISALLALTFVSSVLFAQDVKETKSISEQSYSIYDADLLPATFHAERRQALRELMPANSVAVFFANPIRNRSNDVSYEYHQDPNFFYLTGIQEPHSMVLIFKEEQKLGDMQDDELVFVQNRNPARETWDGKRLGAQGITDVLGFKSVLINKDFADFDFEFSKMDHILSVAAFNDVRDDVEDRGDLFSLILHFDSKTDGLAAKKDDARLEEYMGALRQVKLPEEMVHLRKAIEITCRAQVELMKALEPDMTEYQSEAIVEYFFKSSGSEYTGFPSILGSGENSCILHYTTNRKSFKNNELLVSDIGAEYHGYTADVTRTIPTDGKYSPEEAAIYNLVLKAQSAGIEKCVKGNKFRDPHTVATTIIANGLIELGIIKTRSEVSKYFMHGTSHYLGLDVHDLGLYGELQPGNVITVEPGIYIAEGSDCDEKWWNIGVRIEDDILITEGQPENLSAFAPRTIAEIEAMMAKDSPLGKLR